MEGLSSCSSVGEYSFSFFFDFGVYIAVRAMPGHLSIVTGARYFRILAAFYSPVKLVRLSIFEVRDLRIKD